ncbi:antibiotic biosynthesis monooxygenase family protein [Micromonospora sp. NPDC048170]|uniref:antibiotic biosynthesis monooxygenase family protein n=1 Tax=Micromonospora sp. NPDC048170 TaxID=3154819 RepID=UPI0033E3BFC8
MTTETATGVRVILWYRVPEGDVLSLADTYRRIGEHLAGTPGMVSSELLTSRDEPGVLMVTSRWRTEEDLRRWVHSDTHRHTTPLRPYLDTGRTRPWETFDVASET